MKLAFTCFHMNLFGAFGNDKDPYSGLVGWGLLLTGMHGSQIDLFKPPSNPCEPFPRLRMFLCKVHKIVGFII